MNESSGTLPVSPRRAYVLKRSGARLPILRLSGYRGSFHLGLTDPFIKRSLRLSISALIEAACSVSCSLKPYPCTESLMGMTTAWVGASQSGKLPL
jgi:hypothetical protein